MPQMVHEISAGVIAFRRTAEGVAEFLILQNARGFWEFPKGHVEEGETWQQAAIRELHEESGVLAETLIDGFARSIEYHFKDRRNRLVCKKVHFFLAQVPAMNVRLSHEHRDGAVVSFEQGIVQLTHAPSRGLLRDANEFISKNT